MFFVQELGQSFGKLTKILQDYSMVSSYVINEGKYILMELNVTQEIRWVVSFWSKAEWEVYNIRYFYIFIAEDLKDMSQRTISLLTQEIKNQLRDWDSLQLSWYGSIAAIKMKVLPQLLFVSKSLFKNI